MSDEQKYEYAGSATHKKRKLIGRGGDPGKSLSKRRFIRTPTKRTKMSVEDLNKALFPGGRPRRVVAQGKSGPIYDRPEEEGEK